MIFKNSTFHSIELHRLILFIDRLFLVSYFRSLRIRRPWLFHKCVSAIKLQKVKSMISWSFSMKVKSVLWIFWFYFIPFSFNTKWVIIKLEVISLWFAWRTIDEVKSRIWIIAKVDWSFHMIWFSFENFNMSLMCEILNIDCLILWKVVRKQNVVLLSFRNFPEWILKLIKVYFLI